MTASANYDPWGVPVSGRIALFGFTGEVQDDQGMVYLRARWYTPASGTFTSRDSFVGWPEQPYSLSYYAYALSDPVLFTDATGNYPGYADVITRGETAVVKKVLRGAVGDLAPDTLNNKLLTGSVAVGCTMAATMYIGLSLTESVTVFQNASANTAISGVSGVAGIASQLLSIDWNGSDGATESQLGCSMP
ncbi:MAG: RHS repeat-associated core domain-containing protein [Oscillochloris sp.]|nr:RHS repeat-associated core domain-containing protein [Oscillochloris sp.]